MSIPSSLVTKFFQLLVDRQFADANRKLQQIEEKMHQSEWNRGYIRALRGMMVEEKSSSGKYAFLSKLKLDEENALRKYREDFQAHVKNEIHKDFDRGYFSAWTEFMRVIRKVAANKTGKDEEGKSQSRIESFLKE